MIPIDTMNKQINIRLPEKILKSIEKTSEEQGFSNMQEFIKETIREKLIEEEKISKEELGLVKTLMEASEKENLYGTEKELMQELEK